MVYCSKCGKENEDDAEFCSKCGNKLTAAKKTDTSARKKKTSLDEQVENFAEEIGQLGIKAGKTIEKGVRDFGEEVSDIGKRVTKELEKTGKEFEGWVDRTFGILWPLIVSIIGLAVLWIIIVVMKSTSGTVPVFADVGDFLQTYLWLFFCLMLFFLYTGYASRKYQPFRWISPVLSAIGIILVIWVVIEIFRIFDFFGIRFFEDFLLAINRVLPLIFILVLIFGYFVLMFTATVRQNIKGCEETANNVDSKSSDNVSETSDYRRLYRSGKDRILGGVCGGIGDYFKIDPVLVRIFWVVIVFFPPGLGILLYILFWIIVPRNPNHSWH
ncbi:MAG: PspC domain-containing protein [Candidatus Thermoplasmatota archaeon]|jgi:phage shock protein C|nr:PspC domain-containing protein [Candidatus Thermoplasmatota archaeon]